MRNNLFILFLLLSFPFNVFAETFNVGAVLILTSDQAVYGTAMQDGIEIGLDECNQKLKAKGHKINVIYEDSELRPKQAHSATMKLISQDKIVAGINSAFSEVMANGKLYETHKIPAITLWDSSKQIEALGDYNFGIGLWTPSSAEVSSKFSINKLKAKKAVIIHTQAEWSDTVSELFKADFEKNGGKVLKVFSVHHDAVDFRTILTKTKYLNPDVIYAPLMEDIVPFYKQLRQLKVKSHIVTSDILAKEHIDQLGSILEGVYQSNAPSLGKDGASLIKEKYRARYEKEPKLPLFNAWGYDGIMLICSAIENGALNSNSIKEHLYSLKDYKGLTNSITFTKEGTSPLIEKMYQINKGEFKEVYSIG